MKPAALTSSNVVATTGGLLQSPSVCVASSVFPRFHPGFKAATKADAEMGVKVLVHVFPLDTEAVEELDMMDELVLTEDTALAVVAVPVTHFP